MEKSVVIRRINRLGLVGQILTAIYLAMCIFLGLGIINVTWLILDPNSYIHQTGEIGTIEEGLRSVSDVFQSSDILGVTFSEETLSSFFSADAASQSGPRLGPFLLWLTGMLLWLAVVFASAIFLWKLCTAFRHCASPFESPVIHNMRLYSYSLIAALISCPVQMLLMHSYVGGDVKVGISLETVVSLAVVLLLTLIFQYGAVLQQESDETL